jgi:hypothetical protein
VVTVGYLGSLLDAGHPDEDHADLAAVVVLARLLQARGREPVSLIGDQESGVQGAAGRGAVGARIRRPGCADDRHVLAKSHEVLGEDARSHAVTPRVGVQDSVWGSTRPRAWV